MKKEKQTPRQFTDISSGRHLNLNQLLKESFQGKRDHSNKRKNRKRFLTKTKNK